MQTERRTLPHALTDAEALARADIGAQQQRELRRLQADLAAALVRHKSEKEKLQDLIKEKAGEVIASSEAVFTRRELRLTECVWLAVRSIGYALLFRADDLDGAALDHKRLSETERQLRLGETEPDEMPAEQALLHLGRLGITPEPVKIAEPAPEAGKGKRG